ncbi:hypothetical protein LBMAG16_03340 [Actinomycetes bacterium]|nr:hypothetical protein LBMAG16_03340 [Actinomycetes bacterium]
MNADMNAYQPLSASGHAASWQSLNSSQKSFTSTINLRWENEGWTAEGTLGADNAQFVLRLSAGWIIQQCLLFRDLEDPDLWLGTDSHGRWGEINGAHRTELDGCTDLDFVNTPFTNCIPIRRLPLLIGHSATITVAVIDIETLGITKQTHQYTKVAQDKWRYLSSGTNTEVEVKVDEFGFVLDEPNNFQRII